MEQLFTFPTQVRGNTLDLVLTNIPELITEVSKDERLGSSNHTMITARVQFGEVMTEERDT